MAKKGNIFERIGNLIKATMNHLLDKAEMPEYILKQAIKDMRDEQRGITDALRTVKTQMILNQRQMVRSRESAKIAKAYVEKYQDSPDISERIQNNVELSASNYATHIKNAQMCKTNLEAMQDKYDKLLDVSDKLALMIEKLEMSASRLIAQHKAAQSLRKVYEAMAGINYGEAMEVFQRMEERIEQEDAMAQATAEVASDPSLSPDAAEFMSGTDVDGQVALDKIYNGEADKEIAELE